MQAEIEITCCVRGGMDLLNTTAELEVDWSSRFRDIKPCLRVMQAQIEITYCFSGGLDLQNTTR
jgi:hypothetical protein